ncbi:MAG: hypothetical protein LEGION0398_MBIBDBAK_01399 [Legionellaceae bacterium]
MLKQTPKLTVLTFNYCANVVSIVKEVQVTQELLVSKGLPLDNLTSLQFFGNSDTFIADLPALTQKLPKLENLWFYATDDFYKDIPEDFSLGTVKDFFVKKFKQSSLFIKKALVEKSSKQGFKLYSREISKDSFNDDKNLTEGLLYNDNQKITVDADTSNTETTQRVSQFFYPLGAAVKSHVSDYRLTVYNNLEIAKIPCEIQNAFFLSNNIDSHISTLSSPPIELFDILTHGDTLAKTASEFIYFLGRQEFQLTNEWQAIPSISPSEEMTHFQIIPKEDIADSQIIPSEMPISIGYSERDNLYFLRSSNDQHENVAFYFHYLLKIPTRVNKPLLEEKIHEKIERFLKFGKGQLDIEKAESTGEDYLNYILTQEKGACRHRAVAFKAIMDKEYPHIPVRVILNDCHAFIEI